MSNLIAKLEAAEGGSRELSVDILHAIGWTPERFSHIGLRWVEPGGSMTAFEYETDLPLDPSRSLDAALQLLPPGFMLRKLAEFPDGWSATIVDGAKSFDGQSLTSARLAVCIACLKAIETEVPA